MKARGISVQTNSYKQTVDKIAQKIKPRIVFSKLYR